EDDALILEAHLRNHGLDFEAGRIDSLQDLDQALGAQPWDVLLSDYALPDTDGFEIIRRTLQTHPDLPCIVVSGQVGEEAAVETLRAGAKDFIGKSNLSRLIPAIQRETAEAKDRAEARLAKQELYETERALRQTEALFTTINSHLVDLVAIIDEHGRRIYSSPSYGFSLGYSQEEISRIGSKELVHPDDLGVIEDALGALFRGERPGRLEYRLLPKDGRYLFFESTAVPIAGSEGGPMQALFVARNVTERKEEEKRRAVMEIQLRQAQKMEAIGQLAAGIAHEINTPTQYIGDNARFLRDSFEEVFSLMGRLMAYLLAIGAGEGPAAAEARQALADLQGADLDYLGVEIPKAIIQSLEGVARITKIVGAMKDFSHPGSESRVDTDIHRAIESTVTVSRNEWKYVAELETYFDPEVPLVPCFPGEFNQVILNLIVNAAHAIEAAKTTHPDGAMGRIMISTHRRGSEVEIAVADDGTGIPHEILHRIYDPFFTTKPLGKGTGQGLAIAHGVIVEKHGGRLTVDTSPGAGTTFRI
ncbi:MAG TPA: ATP-binding protein, partial [Geothrix sp.]|nr:ATP-binding protein [Geothrix sp.]